MNINNIDYFVAIYFMDDGGIPNYDRCFENFYELNEFIKQNAENKKYLDMVYIN